VFVSKDKTAVTPAIRLLREQGVDFIECPYKYEDRGGTAVCARELAVNEHSVVKTLIMEDEAKSPLVVLMHGDREVSTKELARYLGVKKVAPASTETAQKLTGYLVGGISPFGTRRSMPVYMEEGILGLPRIFINGGRRGLLVGLDPHEILRVLKPRLVNVGIDPGTRV
jgi:Cys-tRNA(Pro) deacylase